MALHLTLAKATLVALSITAVLSMHNLGRQNGLFDYRPAFSTTGAVLPNTTIPVRQFNTGIPRLDEYLTFMIALFWVDLDPRNIKAHTQGLHFYGTLSSAWLLMVVEAHRSGHSTFFLISTYFIEVIGELAGLGFLTPLWCLLHLATSSTIVQDRSSKPGIRELFLKSGDAAALPLALLLGFGVPTGIMFLGDAAGGIYSQQYWSLLRLIHPLFVLALWGFFRLFTGRGAPQSTWKAASTLRHFYTWSIMLSALGHLLALAPVALCHLSPTWLKPEVIRELEPLELFLPKPFWNSPVNRISSFAEGVSTFLVWDELLTASAIIVWAFTLYVNGSTKVSIWGRGRAIVQAAAWGLVAGPGAAAAFFVQERDNNLLDGQDLQTKKKQ